MTRRMRQQTALLAAPRQEKRAQSNQEEIDTETMPQPQPLKFSKIGRHAHKAAPTAQDKTDTKEDQTTIATTTMQPPRVSASTDTPVPMSMLATMTAIAQPSVPQQIDSTIPHDARTTPCPMSAIRRTSGAYEAPGRDDIPLAEMLARIQGLTKEQQVQTLVTLSKYIGFQEEPPKQGQTSISGPMSPAPQMNTDIRANHQTSGRTEPHTDGIAKRNRSIERALEEPQLQHPLHLTLHNKAEMWEQMEHFIPDDQLPLEPATPLQQTRPAQEPGEYQTDEEISPRTSSPLSQSDDPFLPSSPTEDCVQRDPHRLIPHQPKVQLESALALPDTQTPDIAPAPNVPPVEPRRKGLHATTMKVDTPHPRTGHFLNVLKDSSHMHIIAQIAAANQQPTQPEDKVDPQVTSNLQDATSRVDLITQIAAAAQHQTQPVATAVPNALALTLTPTPAEGFPDIYGHQPCFFIDNLARDLMDAWGKHDMARVAIMPLGSSTNDRVLQPYLMTKIAKTLECAHQIPEVMMNHPCPLYDSKLINNAPYSFVAFNIMKSQKRDIIAQYCYLTSEVAFVAMDFVWEVSQYVCTFAGFTNHSFQDILKLILDCLVNPQSIQQLLGIVRYDARGQKL
ncbi:hypothetical protein SCP_0503430 [Sparassis crispa]|uniref:Uncharacterized protein n=1 Tax=Sparassis crispa TaxID=139825 RepID=A0A401GM71_9APHY|nr:hypothetical protein SCP_0503430 [Sparassis crispa]GBE83295.1 hypothetical protein SCP_0503430 [Sparassis crispa]